MLDKTVEEDYKNNEEDEELEQTPKKKGRPGRKKGIYYTTKIIVNYSFM